MPQFLPSRFAALVRAALAWTVICCLTPAQADTQSPNKATIFEFDEFIPLQTSVIAVSVRHMWRGPMPAGWGGDGPLEYAGITSGWGGEISIPLNPTVGSIHYHLSADELSLISDGPKPSFGGFRLAPVGIGYWGVLPWKRLRWLNINLGFVVTLVQLEYMTGTRELPYATQPSLALGWGAEVFMGLAAQLMKYKFGLGCALGLDTRYLSFQPAGVTSGIGKSQYTWIVRPFLEIRL